MIRKLCFIAALVILTMTTTLAVFATDYDQSFIEVYGLNRIGTSDAMSPLRNSDGTSLYSRVNSNNNQPRTTGTNPHQGTDLRASAGTDVFPIFNGKVVAVNHTLTSQLGSVIINHDVNNDGVYDGYYVKYLHIDPEDSLQVNDIVPSTTKIAVIDIYRQFDPHLHFERCDSAGSKKYKLFNFYRFNSTWNFGSDMDYISGDAFVGNELYITGYTCTANSTNKYALSSLKLYYKIGSGGTWQSTPKEFSVYNSSTYRWMLNFKTATGASTGQTVYYYLVGIRAVDPLFNGTYKHGIWPQYYTHPGYPLSSTYANTICRSFTIQ